MSSPADDNEWARVLIEMAAQSEQVEMEVENVIDSEAGRRYATDPQFHIRVESITQAIAHVAAGKNFVMAQIPQEHVEHAIRSQVIAILAVDDYFVARWLESDGVDMRRGPGHMDGT